MSTAAAPTVAPPRYVGVAQLAAAAGDVTLATLGLGSCVAIVLHDREAGVGALAHVLLPGPEFSRDRDTPGKFPCTAVERMLEEMHALGGRRPRARLVGGASMFSALLGAGGVNIGERNVIAARAVLARRRIPVDAEDVGGEHGRSVFLRVRDGLVCVRSLRAGDRPL